MGMWTRRLCMSKINKFKKAEMFMNKMSLMRSIPIVSFFLFLNVSADETNCKDTIQNNEAIKAITGVVDAKNCLHYKRYTLQVRESLQPPPQSSTIYWQYRGNEPIFNYNEVNNSEYVKIDLKKKGQKLPKDKIFTMKLCLDTQTMVVEPNDYVSQLTGNLINEEGKLVNLDFRSSGGLLSSVFKILEVK